LDLLLITKKQKRMKNKAGVVILTFLPILLFAVAIFGEIRCIYKMCTCNWEPIGKAEIVYTVGTFTGAGVIIGYLNIKDK
jgi:hypothetical protein